MPFSSACLKLHSCNSGKQPRDTLTCVNKGCQRNYFCRIEMIRDDQNSRGKLGQQIALGGLAIYVAFAPHSVAASAIGVSIAGIGWLMRTFSTGNPGLR